MSLLRLPLEILVEIIDYLPPSFFREDIGRLTVCKAWYELARSAFFQSVELTQDSLHHFCISPVEPDIDVYVKSLSLTLEGYKQSYTRITWRSVSPQFPRSPYDEGRAASEPPPRSSTGSDSESTQYVVPNFIPSPVLVWLRRLDEDLYQLAGIMQQSFKLHTLTIRAMRSEEEDPLDIMEDYGYLYSPTLWSLVTLSNLHLTSLVLDITPGFQHDPDKGECHVCPAVATHLETLTKLHVRMRHICPDVLKLPEGENGESGRPLRLENVVINLAMFVDRPGSDVAIHSMRCGLRRSVLTNVGKLKKSLREQAEALATRMEAPDKTVRILTCHVPRAGLQSLDVLTGKNMYLDRDAAWDDDGSSVEECDEDYYRPGAAYFVNQQEYEQTMEEFLDYLDSQHSN